MKINLIFWSTSIVGNGSRKAASKDTRALQEPVNVNC